MVMLLSAWLMRKHVGFHNQITSIGLAMYVSANNGDVEPWHIVLYIAT